MCVTYHIRLNSLRQAIQKNGCDAFLIEDSINLFYMTGLELSTGKLLVHSKGADLLVDGRYLEICKKHSPFPVTQIEPPTFEAILKTPEFAHIHQLGFDTEKTSYKTYETLQKIVKNLVKEGCQIELIPLDSPLKGLRTIKELNEIQVLREAAILGSLGYDYVCSLLKEGITEQECAAELEIFWKRRGSKSLAFDPIIAFGANSSMPHYRAGKTKLQSGHIVLIDIGVNLGGYHSDMTRVVFFGKPETRLLAIHAIVQKAQQTALKLCRPGTTLGELDRAAREVIAEHGYAEYFTHGLGHGVGLDIHEFPVIKNVPAYASIPLEKGMVITIEPGIYLPGLGGVRIEDTVVINESGCENLTLRSSDPQFF
jgi:Xaa-Pro aminopeptidase